MDERHSTEITDAHSECQIPPQSSNESVQCSCPHTGRQILDEVLPISVDEMFTLCFTDSQIHFDFQAYRKNTDLVQTPWSDEPNSKNKTRVVNLTAYSNQSFLPKTTKVTEVQTIHSCSRAGVLYSLTGESTMKGPPMSDSFFIYSHYCIKKVSEKECSIAVFSQIKFKKSIFGLMKGMIEKLGIGGIEDYWKEFIVVLRAEHEERRARMKRKTQKNNLKEEIDMENTKSMQESIEQPQRRDSICTKAIISIFIAILCLAILNVFLYNKLSLLEEVHPFQNLVNQQLMQNSPANSDEWLNSVHKQKNLQVDERKKWLETLKKAINTLTEAEDILSTIKQWSDTTSVGKIDTENVQSVASTSERTSEAEL